MHVIAFASQKGGAGKTTLALHLAVAAERAGYGPIALIDTDAQGTLMRWWQARTATMPAMAEATIDELPMKLAELREAGYRWAIIDTPGRASRANREVIQLANFVFIPVKPSPADLWAAGSTVTVCKELRKSYAFIVSQATRGAAATVQVLSALSEHGAVAPVVIHNRVGFAGSIGDGQTIQEIDPKGAGAKEIEELLAFTQTRFVGNAESSKLSGKAAA